MIYRRDGSRVVGVRREFFDGEVANEHDELLRNSKESGN
jgi:hypothetical protein